MFVCIKPRFREGDGKGRNGFGEKEGGGVFVRQNTKRKEKKITTSCSSAV